MVQQIQKHNVAGRKAHCTDRVCVCQPVLKAHGFPVIRDMSSPRHVHSRHDERPSRSGHIEAGAASSMTMTDDAHDGHTPKPSATCVCIDVGKCAARHEPQRHSTFETTMPPPHMHDLSEMRVHHWTRLTMP